MTELQWVRLEGTIAGFGLGWMLAGMLAAWHFRPRGSSGEAK